jgi:hypothetical protein
VGDYVSRLLPQKVALDTLYATRRSLAMDLRILVWTAVAVIGRCDVAVNREAGRMSVRRARTTIFPASARESVVKSTGTAWASSPTRWAAEWQRER